MLGIIRTPELFFKNYPKQLNLEKILEAELFFKKKINSAKAFSKCYRTTGSVLTFKKAKNFPKFRNFPLKISQG